MDENGAGVLAKGVRDAAFQSKFTRADCPAIRADLDDFLALFAARYGKILAGACNQGRHPPLILPLYQGPDIVYKAVAPYVDGFWFSSHNLKEDALRIYRAGHKPVIAADYIVANPDSPSYFKGKIEKISFDGKKTIVYAPGSATTSARSGFSSVSPTRPICRKPLSRGASPPPPAIGDPLEYVRVRLRLYALRQGGRHDRLLRRLPRARNPAHACHTEGAGPADDRGLRLAAEPSR